MAPPSVDTIHDGPTTKVLKADVELGPQPSRDRRQPVEALRRRHGGETSMAPALAGRPPAPGRHAEPLGSEDRPRAIAEVGLADRLRLRPLAPRRVEARRCRRRRARPRRSGRRRHRCRPRSARSTVASAARRDGRLGRVAIPLGPHGRLGVAEVDRANDAPALPAAIGGLIGPEERLRIDSGQAPPRALDVDPRSRQLDRRAARRRIAQENDSFSSSATSFETSR